MELVRFAGIGVKGRLPALWKVVVLGLKVVLVHIHPHFRRRVPFFACNIEKQVCSSGKMDG